MKVQKLISIESDINEHIKERFKQEGFNFSQWVEDIYRDKYLSIESKEELIKEHNSKVEKLKSEIEEMKIRQDDLLDELNVQEKRFLGSVPNLISEGKEFLPLKNRFNHTFRKNISLVKFRAIIKIIEEEMRNETRKH